MYLWISGTLVCVACNQYNPKLPLISSSLYQVLCTCPEELDYWRKFCPHWNSVCLGKKWSVIFEIPRNTRTAISHLEQLSLRKAFSWLNVPRGLESLILGYDLWVAPCLLEECWWETFNFIFFRFVLDSGTGKTFLDIESCSTLLCSTHIIQHKLLFAFKWCVNAFCEWCSHQI